MQVSELCGIQKLSPDAEQPLVVAMVMTEASPSGVATVVRKIPVDWPSRSHDDVRDEIIAMIKRECATIPTSPTAGARAAIDIAKASRRGPGRLLGKNIVGYIGGGGFVLDTAITVVHDEATDLYSYVCLPNWRDYYRVLV